jgi:hypothetical protein
MGMSAMLNYSCAIWSLLGCILLLFCRHSSIHPLLMSCDETAPAILANSFRLAHQLGFLNAAQPTLFHSIPQGLSPTCNCRLRGVPSCKDHLATLERNEWVIVQPYHCRHVVCTCPDTWGPCPMRTALSCLAFTKATLLVQRRLTRVL